MTSLSQQILTAAVTTVGGSTRPGQQQMADEVTSTFDTGEHALIQAGTGTGKSLGYLAPALAHLSENPETRIIIATATLALQTQLATKDIPTAVAATNQVTDQQITHALLKGRTNYACLLKVRQQVGPDQDALLPESPEPSALGAEVLALRQWAEDQVSAGELGDRDDAPAHTPQGWAQVSIPVRECVGVQKCPFGAECLVEKSREKARASQLVVTNHALLAIDAMHGGTALPTFDALIIDEAHELANRVTQAASVELSANLIDRVAKRCLPQVGNDEVGLDFLEAADAVQQALDATTPGRLTSAAAELIAALEYVRTTARAMISELATAKDDEIDKRQTQAAVQEVFDIAARMAALQEQDVVWVSESDRFGRQLNCAPLSVAELLRQKVFDEHPTVLTSATLKIGGGFDPLAAALGLTGPEAPSWRGVDVGSPFDYRSQGILYIAKGLPAPSRDGINPEALAQIAELLWAAKGRTLGLFASQRSAEAAARYCREHLPQHPILLQGEAHLPTLTSQFIDDPDTSLFGTLSLWQGIDVPGDTCRLVIIDKIPFPRPDDPLLRARQDAVAKAKGNPFMEVAATHAALLLAQGAGRLIRTHQDQGVVAILDPRLETARYGGFLKSSLPDFWVTHNPETAIGALQRLLQ